MAHEGVIILTGAASGIGRAAAEQFAAKAKRLALVDANDEMLNAVVEQCRTRSPHVAGFRCDVTDSERVLRTYRQIFEQFGPASVLINCAGIGRFAPFLEISPEEWLKILNVNLMGAVYFTRAVLPDMAAASAGLILNVSSRMAIDPHPDTTAYAASKAALLAFSKSLAMEVKGRGIKVTVLAPGGTKTNIATPKHAGYLEPEAIADAIVYITESDAKNVWIRDLVILPLSF